MLDRIIARVREDIAHDREMDEMATPDRTAADVAAAVRKPRFRERKHEPYLEMVARLDAERRRP